MIFTTGTGSVCSGGEHFELPITIGGTTKTLYTSREELKTDPPLTNIDETRQLVLNRLKSAVKETTIGVPTLAEIATAVNNKTFEI